MDVRRVLPQSPGTPNAPGLTFALDLIVEGVAYGYPTSLANHRTLLKAELNQCLSFAIRDSMQS
jgi:hypothetical protein